MNSSAVRGHFLLPFCLAALAALALAPRAWAQTTTWAVSVGSWHTTGNWTNGVPNSTKQAFIGTSASNFTSNVGSSASAQGLIIGVNPGNSGTVNVNAGTFDSYTYSSLIGYNGTGTLNIQSGGKFVSHDAAPIIGYSTGSAGYLNVTGAGSQLTSDNNVWVGWEGAGTLTVSAGGKVVTGVAGSGYGTWLTRLGGSTGTLNLNGTAGSRGVLETSYVTEQAGLGGGRVNFNGGILRAKESGWDLLQNFEAGDVQILSGGAFIDTNGFDVYISSALRGSSGGDFTKEGGGILTLTGASVFDASTRVDGGTLEISSGGTVSDTFGYIGFSSGSTGAATVSGSTSRWTNSADLYVGRLSRGTLNILSGAKVSNRNGAIGRFSSAASSFVNVSGTGSEWTQTGDLFVGEEGDGNLLIDSGGKVSNTTGYIGYANGVTAFATVTGAGSQWINSHVLSVGELGNGTLNVYTGGKVTAAYTAIGYHGGTGLGLVSGTNAEWATTNWLDVGSYSNGTLTVQSGGKVSNGALGTIGYGPVSVGTATVTGSGSLWTSTGNLELGHFGTGTLTVTTAGRVTAPATLLAVVDNSKGTLDLNGTAGSRGVLETSYISEGTGTQGGFINFNGGILRATGNQANFLQSFETGDVQILSGGAFIDTQSFNVGISTVLQGVGGLTKHGAGTLTLAGTQGYGGATTVEAGTLLVSGSISSTAATVTGTGSTLGGIGTVGNVTVNSGAILQGGDGTVASGALASAGNVSLTDNSVIKLTLGTGFTHSSLTRTGGVWSFDDNQAFAFNVLNGATAGFYDNLISGLTGAEAGLATIGMWLITSGGVAGTFSYDGTGGVDLTVSVVPEPGSAALLVLGTGLLAMCRRNRLPASSADRSQHGCRNLWSSNKASTHY